MGFWETGRGSLTHYVTLTDGIIDTYQMLTPSTWLLSPGDPFGNQGPCEQALLHTPLLEQYADGEDITGIDVLRAIHSFDPCVVCATH